MAKLVVSRNNQVIRTVPLDKADITCGRSAEADITLDDPAVSRWHLRITTHADASSIEDAGSTNGTYVNGRLTHQAPLADGDVITVGDCQMQYVQEARQADEIAAGGALSPEAAASGESGDDSEAAALEMLSGEHQGKRLALDKPKSRIGRAGRLVAIVSRRDDGFFLMYAETDRTDDMALTVNGDPLPPEGVRLKQDDRIELGDIGMRFTYR